MASWRRFDRRRRSDTWSDGRGSRSDRQRQQQRAPLVLTIAMDDDDGGNGAGGRGDDGLDEESGSPDGTGTPSPSGTSQSTLLHANRGARRRSSSCASDAATTLETRIEEGRGDDGGDGNNGGSDNNGNSGGDNGNDNKHSRSNDDGGGGRSRHRSASYGSHHDRNNAALSVPFLLTSSPLSPEGCGARSEGRMSSNPSSSSMGRCSAITPLASNVTSYGSYNSYGARDGAGGAEGAGGGGDAENDGGTADGEGGGGGGLPPMPSMRSLGGGASPRKLAHLPPRHRRGGSRGGGSGGSREMRRPSLDGGDGGGAGTDGRSSSGRKIPPQQPVPTSAASGARCKTVATLVVLILGLILAAATSLQYAILGPPRAPENLAAKDRRAGGDAADDGSDDARERAEGRQREGRAAADEAEMFDELGRYVVEDYDALPTFSNFLPVSCSGSFAVAEAARGRFRRRPWALSGAGRKEDDVSSPPPPGCSHSHSTRSQGVAGIYGKPVWSFYVNRGQGISSFGVKSKDHPIMEFFSANNAYQNTPLLGFRTFYQGSRREGGGWGKSKGKGKSDESFVLEPFDVGRTRFLQSASKKGAGASGAQGESTLPARTMYIGANEMQIREVDRAHKIETNVTYFTLPEEDFGAFVRRTTIANLDKDRPVRLSVLDGLARIQPVGGKLNEMLKTMGRTLEGWMGVYDADRGTMPFFRMSTEPQDTAAVVVEEAGHFCLSYLETDEKEFLPVVYDASKVFGRDSSLMRPVGLYATTVKGILEGEQYGAAKTSSAFAAIEDVTIYPSESITITTYYGRAQRITDVPVIARRIVQGGFARYKLSRARGLIKQITADVETRTGNKLFDGHVKQMYLDNSLRGGVPVLLGEIDDRSHSLSVDEDGRIKVYHLFSRIHGDLERDYNDFVIEPTFFSQGPGNFRDVAQNRRNDVIINPRIGSFNVQQFLTFIQADGYNPLSVEAVVFAIDDQDECNRIAAKAVGYADGHRADREALAEILCEGSFRPGQLAEMIEDLNISIMTNLPELIDNVAASATIYPMAVSKDGYWADHWTYYMDLINSYLKIYPDREENLLYDEELPYYFSYLAVQPRARKYVLSMSFNGKHHHVRQLNPSYEDSKRKHIMRRYVNKSSGWYKIDAHYQHSKNGDMIKSTPIAKLFLLATVKFATRDALGMGIEYEGGKPGWNDAMNGLVGMLGSGMPETYELKVLLLYIKAAALKYKRPIVVPEELADLIQTIEHALNELGNDDFMPPKDQKAPNEKVVPELFRYWDRVSTAREEYRAKMDSFSGEIKEYPSTEVVNLLERWIAQVDLGIERAHAIGSHGYDKADSLLGITPTYFAFNVTKWTLTGKKNKEGHHFVNATELSVGKFPLFLEGVVRMMKTLDTETTYFAFNVTKWTLTGKKNKEGHHFVNATELSVGKFPLFLEGVVRMMKTLDTETAASLYKLVKKSGLRDEGLKMYTLSSSLVGQSYDMGRMMAFSPGWLENQSVWMHMSYKYYLELLRKGMYKDFFAEMQSGMLPFINETKYGRSLLECSSFIASSAFVDPTMRGQGFLARLSGSTAEFLSMWVLMMIGPSPLFLNEESGQLEMQLIPALPFWLLEHDPAAVPGEQYSIQFKLFTSIDVIYYTSEPRDLFGISPVKYEVGLRDGSKIEIGRPTIPNDLAMNIRRVVFIDYIRAYF
ncbi:hypothetical protein ACHAWF_018253 [Thalassiosira exigua]